ncbi:hypothetical protein GCM10009575_000520 [Streptomyces rhizosphaericus]|uniref:Uncharacterized protein n=1 Tax=Streptomyces rhizosphaericus TaxID=114699 RepID=A0ABN1NQW2_9ACTN|nr:hypothetical protein [Streptomyces cangkringensis]
MSWLIRVSDREPPTRLRRTVAPSRPSVNNVAGNSQVLVCSRSRTATAVATASVTTHGSAWISPSGILSPAADPARFLALVEEFTQATSPADGSREHWRLLVEGEPGRTPDDPHGAVNRALEREFREASERSAT